MDRNDIDQMITFIYVSDLDRSRQFYEEIMGFSLWLDQGTCRIVEANQEGGGLLGYCSREGDSAMPGDLIVTLVTSAVDEWYDYLIENGVSVLEPPNYNQKYMIYHFFFTDPDGYKLEIQEFRDLDW